MCPLAMSAHSTAFGGDQPQHSNDHHDRWLIDHACLARAACELPDSVSRDVLQAVLGEAFDPGGWDALEAAFGKDSCAPGASTYEEVKPNIAFVKVQYVLAYLTQRHAVARDAALEPTTTVERDDADNATDGGWSVAAESAGDGTPMTAAAGAAAASVNSTKVGGGSDDSSSGSSSVQYGRLLRGHYDVVVVGNGFRESLIALLCAQQGDSVLHLTVPKAVAELRHRPEGAVFTTRDSLQLADDELSTFSLSEIAALLHPFLSSGVPRDLVHRRSSAFLVHTRCVALDGRMQP